MGVQLLRLHWKGARWPLFPFLVLLGGLPLVTWRFSAVPDNVLGAGAVLEASISLGMFYPILAAAIGAVVALTAWNWDHQTGHVYPLSLPISRARYAALKFAAGAAILAVPTVLLLVLSAGSSLFMELPVGLRTYPASLALHFFTASLTVYGLLFALAAGRMRTAVIVLSTLAATVLFGSGVSAFLVDAVPGLEYVDLTGTVIDLMIDEGGPFHVFFGNWSLVDV